MQKNNQEEKLNLALLYHKEGQEQNHQKAFELFQECLIQGDVRANLYLGIIFEKGLGVSQNFYKAKEFFAEAYKSGIKGASAYLGSFYLYGKACKQDYQQALKLFCEATRECNPLGDFYLGIMYEEGLLVKKSEKRAVACYESAGQEGVLEAYYRLGAMYAQGRGVRKNKKKATELLALSCGDKGAEKQSKANDEKEAREALDSIAKKEYDKKMYYEIGVELYGEEKYQDALNFFLKGEKLGCDKSMYYLGRIYEEEKWGGISVDKAIKYYKKASKLGNPYASYRLGRIYEDEEGIESSYTKAMRYFYLAIKNSSSQKITAYSLNSIASFYEYGQGVKQNEDKAIELYLQSLDSYWNEYALFALGHIYEYREDYNQAIYYYECAGKLGYGYALYCLSELYRKTLKDYSKAIQAFEQALELDLDEEDRREALYQLGYLYFFEVKDCQKGIRYFWEAGEANSIDAYCTLAKIYFNTDSKECNQSLALECATMAKKLGGVVPEIEGILKEQEDNQRRKVNAQESFEIGSAFLKSKNYKKAYAYFLESFNMGNLDACVKLGYMFENGLGVDVDIEKAKDYYEKASRYNHKTACYNLGVMYRRGRGVEKNLDTALKYFEISFKQGDCDAGYEIGKIYELQRKFHFAKDFYISSYQAGNQKALERYNKIKNRPNIFDKVFGLFLKRREME